MSLKIERFINQLMTSNCYIVADEESKHCLCIDPASEKSEREIEYIEQNGFTLDDIIVTHEHTDHTWGVNTLKEKYPEAKLLCSELCDKYAKQSSKAYFLFYYGEKGYRYELMPADILINDDIFINWHNSQIGFLLTPGHSKGSMCIDINGRLFSGDTIMPYPSHLNKRDSSIPDLRESIEKITRLYRPETIIMPGHGDTITLRDWLNNYWTI